MAGLETWHGAGDATVEYVEVQSWGPVRVAAGAPTGPVSGRPAAAAAFEAQAQRDGARVLWFAVQDPADVEPGRPSVVIGAEPVWRVGRWSEILEQKASSKTQLSKYQKEKEKEAVECDAAQAQHSKLGLRRAHFRIFDHQSFATRKPATR